MEVVNLNIGKPCKMAINNIGEYLPGQNVQDEIRENGIWGKEETSILIDVFNNYEKGTFIDVGSNTGYFSIISMLYGNKTISIEANEKFQDYINTSMEINDFDLNNFTYHEKFASNSKENILFDGWSGHSELVKENKSTYKETITIDELCQEALFIKIDVEGCEPQVIKSAENIIKNKGVKYIMFEFTYIINDIADNDQVEMIDFLTENGYQIFHIGRNLNKIENIKEKVYEWYNNFLNSKKINPNIKTSGTNLLAVLEDCYIPNTNIL
jgi:hypothetical protein